MPRPAYSFPLRAAEAAAAIEVGENLTWSFLYNPVQGQTLGSGQHTCPTANAMPRSYLTMEFIPITATPPPRPYYLVFVLFEFRRTLVSP